MQVQLNVLAIFHAKIDDISVFLSAWVGSAALAIACLFSPVVGLLCNRYDYRRVTIGGGLTCAIGLFLTAHAPNLPVVYITYTIIFGFGASCAYTSAFIVVTDYFSKWRSLATGITCAGSSCGVLVMTPIISVCLTVCLFVCFSKSMRKSNVLQTPSKNDNKLAMHYGICLWRKQRNSPCFIPKTGCLKHILQCVAYTVYCMRETSGIKANLTHGPLPLIV